jgi:thimet oligopeptidase
MLGRMLERRHELANLLGYPTWADFITEDKMIGSAARAQTFIDEIDALARHRAEGDYQELLAAKKKSEPSATEVMDWQKTFLEEQVKRDSYAFDSQTLRQYLPFGRVRDGILNTTAKMFGVTFQKVDRPVWHDGVVAYEMADKDGLIGRFYLDLHPRPNKYKHAAAFPLRSGVANVQVPEAALVCNFPEGEDALLEHNDVETFFHEFGHLLHHLFAGKQKWVGLSGIATEWDFVEAPSQMLEEWSFDGPTLKSFAQNGKGQIIGDDLIAALRRARGLGRGLWVRQQMFYAATSLGYHQLPPEDPALGNTDVLMQKLQARYSPFAFVPDTHFQLSFGHLEGYSAIYYTYLWSLVIAKDLFTPFEAAPSLTDGAVADRYRRAVLAPGGSKKAADLVADFLGRPSSFDAFGKWVNAAD